MAVRAVVAAPDAPGGVALADVDSPRPGPRHLLVETHHVSLNRGDLNDARSGRVPAGHVLGSDVAGVVLKAAANGEGPPVGAWVVGMTAGAFAARVAIDVDAVAEVPAGVDLAEAATLPVAGVAAMQALRSGLLETPVKGARVLVTGATGGVGRFAVQLAAYAGGHVIAVARAERAEELRGLGAEEVIADPTELGESVDLVLDNVGGPQLVEAWQRLVPGGSVQCIGWSSGEPATFPPYSTVGPMRTLSSFLITPPVAPDLTNLVRLLEQGDLRVTIAWRGRLNQIDAAVEAMRQRRVSGKAVLDLPAASTAHRVR